MLQVSIRPCTRPKAERRIDQPLGEAELLSVCHAPVDHPARDHPLILRKIVKTKRYDDRAGSSSPLHNMPPSTATGRSTKRASAVSILSDLGVHNPEKALEPSSPTSGRRSPATSGRLSPAALKRPSKLRNFFGQRPPSELITTHLTEYFPFTEKKVLERTARHSMMRSSTISRRESTASYIPPLPSRFSSSTQGSQTRADSPTRNSISSSPYVPDKSDASSNLSAGDEIPRVSISTEDGDHVDLDDEDHPQLLPPIPFPSESLSESMESLTGNRRMSRSTSNASRTSRRMSYMTELRSKRDRSDTASLMTVDQITAEVESRRESKNTAATGDPAGSDTDDWTKLEENETEETTDVNEDDEGESSAEEVTLNDGDDDELGKVTIKKGTHRCDFVQHS